MLSRREHGSLVIVARRARGPLGTLCAAALLAVSVAAPVRAQDSTQSGRTHVVRKHDTLWDLSHQYLGDPFLWPFIYRVNTDVVQDPHWIYPGERLRIPGAPVVASEAADSATPATQPFSEVPEVAEAPAPPVQPVVALGPTVFRDERRIEAERPRVQPPRNAVSLSGMMPPPAVRPDEVYPAPWIDDKDGPAMSGRLIARAEPLGIAATQPINKLGIEERVYVTLPKTSVPVAGDRFLTYRLGPMLPEGQMVVPTGIVVVERADNGDATTVRIVRMFDEVEIGNGIIPLASRPSGPAGVTRTHLELGTMAKVVWIPSEPVLPTIQRYVVLDVTAPESVSLGDQFTLLRPRVHRDDGTWLPEEPIALAQVVRITNRSVTAIIVDQRHPTISVGTEARLTARVP